MKLADYQKDFMNELLELDEETGKRRYRRGFLQVARKAGKSQLASALSLYAAVTGEAGGEVIYAAAARAQAGICFDRVKFMIESDPELRQILRVYRHHVEQPQTGTTLKVISSDAGLQQGLTPSFVVADEVAMWADERLWDALSLGMASREQPMMVAISTPGWSKDSLAYRLYEHSLAVRSGLALDPSFYARIYEAPREMDWKDPRAWRLANPAIDAGIISEEDYASAVGTTHEQQFRRFYLGQWVESKAPWLHPSDWDACGGEATIPSGTKGVVAGVDIGFRRDSSAVVVVRKDGDEVHAVARIWSPSQDEDVDLAEVESYIRDLARRYPKFEVAVDPAMFIGSVQRLQEAGIEVVEVQQNPSHMVPATSYLYELVKQRKLRHGGDEELREHALAASIKSTPRGAWITHGEDKRPMDGATALALAVYRLSERKPPRKSAYETGGLRTV